MQKLHWERIYLLLRLQNKQNYAHKCVVHCTQLSVNKLLWHYFYHCELSKMLVTTVLFQTHSHWFIKNMAVEILCIISLLSNFQTPCTYQLTTTGSGTGMFSGWWTSVKSRLPNCSVSSNSFNSTIFFGKPWRIKSSAWNIHKPTDQLKRLKTFNDLQFTNVLRLMRR